MKIGIIGPGYMPIPPKGWGAIESLIWDYSESLLNLGHEVYIYNSRDFEGVIEDINSKDLDFVHLQFDDYTPLMEHVKCPNKAVTSHYAYLEQPDKHGAYKQIFDHYAKIDYHIFALSEGIKQTYIKELGVSPEKIKITPNGANSEMFLFSPECVKPDKSICLAKIDPRKKQSFLQGKGLNIDFAGNQFDTEFDYESSDYLGEWEKTKVYENLTDYANMVLLSDGEAHSLSCLEGLMSGLGLVISEQATANLDLSLPFIDVINETQMQDSDYLREVIEKNRKSSLENRKEIREYAEKNFDWGVLVEKYEDTINEVINENEIDKYRSIGIK